MGKILTALALAAAVCWPLTVQAGSENPVPERGMSKAEVRARFGEPQGAWPPVGQPPISRWDYDGFSVYFENDTTLHSVREQERARAAGSSRAGEIPGGQPVVHSSPEAEAGLSPANGEEPPTVEEELETNVEVETFKPPRNNEEDDEASTESDSAPGSTAVRANAEGSGKRSEEDHKDGAENNSDGSTDDTSRNGAAKGDDTVDGRFRFDPATGRIVVDDPQEDEASDPSTAR